MLERINLLFDKDTFHEIGKIAGKASTMKKVNWLILLLQILSWEEEILMVER